MEELRKRLSFDDLTIRSKCLQKLVQIVKRKSRGEILTSSSVHIPELNLIWETCNSDSSSNSNLAVKAIIHLTLNQHLEVNYAINKLLSCLLSTNHAWGIVKGISKLLLYESDRAGDVNPNKYSLHYQRHPLIAVIQKDDDYLPLIFESISEAIADNNLRGFQVMEPVICYILANPSKKKNNDYSKTVLIETLIEAVKDEPKTAFYILRCIPFLQVENYQQVAETANFIFSAKRAFRNCDCEENERLYISELLLLSSLSLCDRSLDVGFNPRRLFDVAVESCLFLSKSNKTTAFQNTCLVLISMILRKSTGELLEKAASLAVLLLDLKEISQTASAFLAFTVIQLLPEPTVISFSESTNSILSSLLQKLEDVLDQENINKASEKSEKNLCPSTIDNFNRVHIEAFTFSVESSMLCAKFAIKLDGSRCEFKLNWLKSIAASVKSGAVENLDVIFSLVAALFLMSPDDPDYINTCLETLEEILQKNTHLSTKLFALLLYKQNLLSSHKSKLMILEFLPKSATHKHSIPPVLSILKMMSGILELKPKAIHLMLQLWKKHDRCFSYLHKLLVESSKVISSDLGVNGTLISQTAAIKEICEISPEKRGVEFLGILSKVINESNDEASSPAACLALDGVISLCKSEVTDLRSTWKILGPRLGKDKRTSIICRMFKLLSIVPDFPVKSAEFDKYLSEMVAFIWKKLSAGVMAPEAISCAYQALAKFPIECHVLKQLPSCAKENLELPISMKATPFDMGKLPEDVLDYIPGHCFLDLLKSLDDDKVLKGYTEFLTSLVNQEVIDLPRSVYNPRKHLQKRQNANNALSKVPKVLCSQFEARRSLPLQRNLAFGVLLCYEPPLEMGKDGEPIKRSVASQCRFYEQVLGVLLNEVNIDTTEWQRCILLPNAWGDFMERAFIACEESRKAELELQKNLGHRDFSLDEFSLQCKTTWLWVRDRLLNLIKTSVKNAATSHANAVFAVSGLVQASHKFRSTLDDTTKVLCDENENHVLQQTFEEECTETILCAMMPNYQPEGKVHSWLLTHLSRPNSSTAYLIRGCGCCALSHLTPVLTNSFAVKIPNLYKELVQNLSDSSPVLSFYSGVGLGLFTKSLFDSGFTDTLESLFGLALDTAKQIQEMHVSQEDPSLNILVSLTMVMTALSQIDQEDCKDWISTTCNLYHEKLMEEEISSMNFEALSVCVSAMMISAADGGCIPVETVLSLTTWFDDMQVEQPQCSGISVSCGILIEALERFGHSQGTQLKSRLQKEWFTTVSSDKRNTLFRIAALNGLCSLFSCGRGLLQAKTKEESSNLNAVNELVSFMFQMLNAERDSGLQSICSWEVGRLFSVHCFKKDADSAVPSSYSYLGDKSVLKPLITAINPKNSTDTSLKPHHLLACLSALGKKFPRPLPPLNWNELLIPFLEQNADPSLVYSALSIAIHQASGSPFATNVLASYSCPPLFHTLPENCHILLFQNIPELVSNLPPHKLKTFLHTVATTALKQDPDFQLKSSLALQGIQDALILPNQKQQAINTLHNTVFYLLKQIKKDINLLRKQIEWISSTLSYLPEKKVESMLTLSTDNNNLSTVLTILSFLVRTGQRSLSSLRACVNEGKHVSLEIKEQMCAALYECFLPCENEKSEVNQPDKCISWLLQIIGWINLLNDSKSQYQLMSVGEVFLYLNDVCMAVIIGCSGLECSYNFYPVLTLSHAVLLENLPVAISKLIMKEEWSKIADKIIAWMMMIFSSPHLKENDKHFVKLSLYAVRGSSKFQELEVWTNVVSSIY